MGLCVRCPNSKILKRSLLCGQRFSQRPVGPYVARDPHPYTPTVARHGRQLLCIARARSLQ